MSTNFSHSLGLPVINIVLFNILFKAINVVLPDAGLILIDTVLASFKPGASKLQ